MPPFITLALVAGLPLLVTLLARIKPLYLFVSVVTGYLLVTYLGDTAELTLNSFVHIANPGVVIRLFLLLLPVVLSLLLMRKSLSAAALPFQFILLVGDSLLLAEFMLPLLTPSIQGAIRQTPPGEIVYQAHDVLIAGVALLHVIVMWLMRSHGHNAHGHGKKHH